MAGLGDQLELVVMGPMFFYLFLLLFGIQATLEWRRMEENGGYARET